MNPKAIRWALSVWIFGLCVCLMGSVPMRAQVAGATLSGTITDAQGGAVPGAKVSARNVATGVSTDSETNGSGLYTIPNLNAGDYEVSVTASGFSTAVSKLTLTVGQKQELNIPLAVGQVEQSVQVTTEAPQVELESSTVSDEVESTTVRELPLNGRDWTSLATLQPGVASVRTQMTVGNSAISAGRGLGTLLTVSGARPTQNSYRLDGIIVNDYSNAGPGSVLGKNLGVDAIQEFSVLTSDYSAEYGFTSGGVINAITKSGTNSFHGTAFDFLRNDVLDATNYFNNAGNLGKNLLQQNQFGAAGGWRILKDKLFVFGDYEGVRLNEGLPQAGQTTLTPAVQAGMVTNLDTGNVVNVNTTITPANPSGVDPTIHKFLGFWPAPSANFLQPGGVGCNPLPANNPWNAGGCNPNVARYVWEGNQAANENFYTFRSDYKISDKDSIYGTYLHDYSKLTTPGVLNNEPQEYDSWRQAIIFSWTHVYSASVVNSIRGGYDHTNDFGAHTTVANNPLSSDPSLAMAPGFFSPNIAISGSGVSASTSGLGWGGSIQDYAGNIFQFYDDAFVSKGNHGLKFGLEILGQQTDGYHPVSGGNGNGNGTFSSAGMNLGGKNTKVATAIEGNNAGNVLPVGGGCFNPATKGGATAANIANGGSYEPSCGSLVNFLTNQPTSGFQPVDLTSLPFHHLRSKIFGGYVQDDWRFRPNLTFNVGLRYEAMTDPTENRGMALVLPSLTTSLTCGPVVVINTTCPQAGNLTVAGNPVNSLRDGFFVQNPTLKNFEPRLGFAWDPFKNGKTSVRGGFGVFDALPLPYELILDSISVAPYRNSRVSFGSNGQLSPNQFACAANPVCAATLTPGNPTGTLDQFPFNIVADSATLPSVAASYTRTWQYVDPAPARNYVFQYNFSVQRQITPNTTVLIGYIGSRGVHNPFQVDTANTILPVNFGHPIPGVGYYWPGCFSSESALIGTAIDSSTPGGQTACANFAGTQPVGQIPTEWVANTSSLEQQSLLLNPTSSSIPATMWESSSFYNALQINVVKRMSRGFQVQGAFTWSKSIDDSSGSAASDNYASDYTTQPWWDLHLVRGLSDFNVGKNLVINGLWDAPTPKFGGPVVGRLLGGWELGLITDLSSGVPVMATIAAASTGDILGQNISEVQPPEVLAGCSPQNLVNHNYRSDPNLIYVNSKCLGLVPMNAANAAFCDQRLGAGTCSNIRGNLGRNTIIGPGLFNMDASIFKNNYIPRISEAFNIQFRAEFFDVLNRANFAPPQNANLSPFSSNLAPPTTPFGQITQIQGNQNRVIQLALKVVW